MRTMFIETLCELAAQDERIWLVTGDLGYSVLERFAQRFPDRYVNAGVAEQNMTGLAAGLAHSGKIAFTYSIANFPVMRCLEQIRNDVCYHNLAVRVVAVGGGFAYGSAGYTHHGVEDFAVLRALPNMTVIAPADPVETRLLTRALISHPGPAYLRLGKSGEPMVHKDEPKVEIGTAVLVRDGSDLTLVSTGAQLGTALGAADMLAGEGLIARVLSMHTVKPLDEDAILTAARETTALFTIEEHRLVGGLGSAVAEVLAEAGQPGVRFKRFGVSDESLQWVGSQSYLCERTGLSSRGVARAVLATMANRP